MASPDDTGAIRNVFAAKALADTGSNTRYLLPLAALVARPYAFCALNGLFSSQQAHGSPQQAHGSPQQAPCAYLP